MDHESSASEQTQNYLDFASLRGAALTALEGTAAGAGVAFNCVRWSFRALISRVIFALRSFNLTRLALIFATALAALDAGAFFAADGLAAGVTVLADTFLAGAAGAFGATFFAEGFNALAGADFDRVVAALGAAFFAVAIF